MTVGEPALIAICGDPQTVRVLEPLLGFEGWRVESYEALPALADAIDRRRPALAILDTLAPGFGEPEPLERLHAAGVPLLVLSSYALSPRERARLRGFGASILSKPFWIEPFLQRVRRAAHALHREVHTAADDL